MATGRIGGSTGRCTLLLLKNQTDRKENVAYHTHADYDDMTTYTIRNLNHNTGMGVP